MHVQSFIRKTPPSTDLYDDIPPLERSSSPIRKRPKLAVSPIPMRLISSVIPKIIPSPELKFKKNIISIAQEPDQSSLREILTKFLECLSNRFKKDFLIEIMNTLLEERKAFRQKHIMPVLAQQRDSAIPVYTLHDVSTAIAKQSLDLIASPKKDLSFLYLAHNRLHLKILNTGIREDKVHITAQTIDNMVKHFFSLNDLFVWERDEEFCFLRAHIIRAFLVLMGIPASDICNIYLIPPKNISLQWTFHVAVCIKSLKRVIDPQTNTKKASSYLEWGSETLKQECSLPLMDLSEIPEANIEQQAQKLNPAFDLLNGALFITDGHLKLNDTDNIQLSPWSQHDMENYLPELAQFRWESDEKLIKTIFDQQQTILAANSSSAAASGP